MPPPNPPLWNYSYLGSQSFPRMCQSTQLQAHQFRNSREISFLLWSRSLTFFSFKLNLAIECDRELAEYTRADWSFNPQYGDAFYLYRKWRRKNHGERNGKAMFTKLEEIIKEYNQENGSEGGRAFLQKFERSIDGKMQKWEDKPGEGIDTPLVLAVCTPLMARAHAMLQQAGELVYCDSTYICPEYIKFWRGDTTWSCYYFWRKWKDYNRIIFLPPNTLPKQCFLWPRW